MQDMDWSLCRFMSAPGREDTWIRVPNRVNRWRLPDLSDLSWDTCAFVGNQVAQKVAMRTVEYVRANETIFASEDVFERLKRMLRGFCRCGLGAPSCAVERVRMARLLSDPRTEYHPDYQDAEVSRPEPLAPPNPDGSFPTYRPR